MDRDRLTDEQKAQALQETEDKRKKRLFAGRVITYSVASSNIALSVLSAAGDFDALTFVIQMAFSAALFTGLPLSRYLFTFGVGLNAYLVFSAPMASEAAQAVPAWVTTVIWGQLAYSVVTCFMLYASKYVGEFMYERKNK